MKKNPLGKSTPYADKYNPSLLFPIPRAEQREKNNLQNIPFSGYDFWNCYELSWLNPSGRPEVGILRIVYSCESEYIVESKSLKLYLGSFHMSTFSGRDEVLTIIRKDLEHILKAKLERIEIFDAGAAIQYDAIDDKKSTLLDKIDIETAIYEPDPSILKIDTGSSGEKRTCISNLLKSNCPVTGQPDWATVKISYHANRQIDDASLLKYIISYRKHQGFHESCCEMIYRDLYLLLEPESLRSLSVTCSYTRRGGIDISSCRGLEEVSEGAGVGRYWRQ